MLQVHVLACFFQPYENVAIVSNHKGLLFSADKILKGLSHEFGIGEKWYNFLDEIGETEEKNVSFILSKSFI
jgi:hypothetical protein